MIRNPSCTRCPLHAATTYVCLMGEGPQRARLMLVGEAPGGEEERTGRPFVGDAGKKLTNALSLAGINRQDVYITNATKCRPPGNRTPQTSEVDACAAYLLQEIEAVDPDIIVCLGGSPLKALTGKTAVGTNRGTPLEPRKGFRARAQIFVTYHPASILHNPTATYFDDIVADFKVFARMLAPARDVSHEDIVTVRPGQPIDDAIDAIEKLAESPYVAADLEWASGIPKPTGKSEMQWPWHPQGEVFSIAFTGIVEGRLKSVAIALPCPDMDEAIRYLLKTVKIVFHNAMSDMLWLKAIGWPVKLAGDTMLLGKLLDESQSAKLEALAPRYAPEVVPGWKGHLRQFRPDNDADWDDLLQYNAEDTRTTFYLFRGLSRAIKALPAQRRDDIIRVHREILLPALPVLLDAAYLGVPIDETLLAEETTRSAGRQREAIERLSEITSLTPANAAKLATSPEQTKTFIHRALGIDLANTTKDVLSLLEYEPIKLVLRIRAEEKILSTYLRPWSELLARQGDGRTHTVYRIAGTRTGRLSSELERGGPIHVAPRGNSTVPFRKLIRTVPGRKIVAADFSQIELRTIAWIANEPTMIGFYRDGVDLHTATAGFMLAMRDGVTSVDDYWPIRDEYMVRVTKPERQGAKPVNFGFAYGMMEDKFVLYSRTQYGIPITREQATEFRNGYFSLFSTLLAWHERSRSDCRRNGYRTRTPFGRWRSFDEENLNACINTPIQSSASDITMLAMVQVDQEIARRRLDAVVIGQIHDSILLDVRDEHVDEVSALLKAGMENVDLSAFAITLPVPLVADVTASETWG